MLGLIVLALGAGLLAFGAVFAFGLGIAHLTRRRERQRQRHAYDDKERW